LLRAFLNESKSKYKLSKEMAHKLYLIDFVIERTCIALYFNILLQVNEVGFKYIFGDNHNKQFNVSENINYNSRSQLFAENILSD
jgi:hypothetical protein